MKQLLFLLILPVVTYSQSITKEAFYNTDLPSFSLYDDTYFITGVPLDRKIDESTADVKYNISFSQLLSKKSVLWDSYIYFSYTQKAFWDIFEKSSPFNEINFNPAISIAKPFWFSDDHLASILELKGEHESNGRDGEISRSWNKVTLSYTQSITNRLQAELDVWVPVGDLGDNPDIMDYMGYGELILDYDFIPKVLNAEVSMRNTFDEDWKGAIRGRVFLRIGEKTNQYFMVEYYNGYGENLLNYDEHTQMIRIGYALKSRWDKLFKF